MAEFRSFKADAAPEKPDVAVLGREVGGFSFDMARRNAMLASAGTTPAKALKTGTTICGVVFKGGVVLGADTRATEGETVADKNCEKIHYMAPNIYCCGAGTAADTEQVTAMASSQLELLRLQTRRQTRVATAMVQLKRHLFKYQGHVGAYLVLGGVDVHGPHLHMVWAAGSTDTLPFMTMGSGSLAAMAVMESSYKDDMTESEAVDLVSRAIRAGIFNDLGSGSNVDICIIRQAGEAAKGAGAASSAAAAAAAGAADASVAEALAAPVVLASPGVPAGPDKPVNVGNGVQVMYRRNYEVPSKAGDFRAGVAEVAGKTVAPGATEVVATLFRKHVVVEPAEPEDADMDA